MAKNTRAKDWLSQAKDDLAWGEASLKGGFFAQSCFVAQQASEKALKALAYQRGYDLIKGHSVRVVAKELGFNDKIEEAAKILDQYYISTRYPDSLPAGSPFEYFSENQAREALAFAKMIIECIDNEFKCH